MKITTLEQLHAAALRKKAVVVPSSNMARIPAAFLIGLPGTVLLRLFRKGITEYKGGAN